MISKSFRKKIGLYDQFSLTLDIEIGQLTQQLKDLVGQKAPKKMKTFSNQNQNY